MSEGAGQSGGKRPSPAATTVRYSRYVGLAFLVFAAFVGFKLIGSGTDVNSGLKAGEQAPEFAAPSATGSLDGVANVFQTTDEARDQGHPAAACDIKLSGVIRICDYFDKPLVLVVWSTKCGKPCVAQVDDVERLRQRFPNVNFVALELAGSKQDTAKTVRSRGWKLPVAIDEDGAATRLYNVAVPPAVFFILPGGRIQHSAVSRLQEPYLSSDVRALVKKARQEGVTGPTGATR